MTIITVVIEIIWGISLTYLVVMVSIELRKRGKYLLELELERQSRKMGYTFKEADKIRKGVDYLSKDQKRRLNKEEPLTIEELEKLRLLVEGKM